MMLKSREREVVKHARTRWLLGLLFLVQLWSLASVDSHMKAVLIADLLVLLIGAGLAWLVWREPEELSLPSPRPIATPPAQLDELKNDDSKDEAADNLTAMMNELAHKAQHDALTGLPNRSLALDRLQQAIQRAERQQHPVAVMFIDLNGFKPLNDTYGHDFGDKVLRKTAERLTRSIREVDTVARLGGDEFLIVMEQLNESKAVDTAETLATIVQQPIAARQGPVRVSMSTGIAVYPKHGTSARHLLRAADAAMYQSKREKGRPVVAACETQSVGAPSPTGRFTETTTMTLKMLDTWEGTLRNLRALPEE